jgi:predicted DNA-binding transcriptional regulator YafY
MTLWSDMTNGKQSAELTLVRRMLIIDKLPGGEQTESGMTIRELLSSLVVDGMTCGIRTVERDLEAIDEVGSAWRRLGVDLQKTRREGLSGRAVCWRHAPNSKGIFLRAMSDEQALMLTLVEQELRHFMPPSAYDLIRGYVAAADRRLANPSNARQAHFRDLIRVIAEGPEVGAPQTDAAHLGEINEALLRGEQLDMRYWSSKDKQEKPYRLHPIGLVKQGRFFWLLAVKHEKTRHANLLDSVQTFRADRIRQIARRRQEVVDKRIPTLDESLESGNLAFFPAGMIDLRLRFVKSRSGEELCENFRDTPLDLAQRIIEIPNAGMELHATVRYTRQLVWTLQRVAHLVRVEEPAELRNEIIAFTRGAAHLQLGVSLS